MGVIMIDPLKDHYVQIYVFALELTAKTEHERLNSQNTLGCFEIAASLAGSNLEADPQKKY